MAEGTPINSEQEQAAFRALIVAAFRQDYCEDEVGPDGSAKLELALNDDDLKALNALGDDLVDRILVGDAAPASSRRASATQGHLVAMNRGGDLTDEARKEMERKIQESKEKGPKESGA